MNQKSIFPKVAVDMFLVQGMWASAFLGVMVVVQIIRSVISTFTSSQLSTFFVSTFIASSIFMLVVGIIATYGFMPHFVGNGVTRKDFFKGASLGAIGLAIALPIISSIISLIEKGIVTLTNLPIKYEPIFESKVEEDPSFIEEIFRMIFTTNFNDSSHWVIVVVIFAVNLLTFYLIGWIIGSAFYKHLILGFLGIVMGIFILYCMGHIVAMLFGAPVTIFANTFELPDVVLIIIILFILVICFSIIRLLTKKAVIKI